MTALTSARDMLTSGFAVVLSGNIICVTEDFAQGLPGHPPDENSLVFCAATMILTLSSCKNLSGEAAGLPFSPECCLPSVLVEARANAIPVATPDQYRETGFQELNRLADVSRAIQKLCP